MSRTSLVVLLLLALAWLADGSVRRALPPDEVVILAGPVGGSFDAHAQRYAARLRAAGFATRVENEADSLKIVDALQAGARRVDIGFTAQALDEKALDRVRSVGVVELQPLFLFVRASLGEPVSPAALQGRRLVMPPPGSASAQAALKVLAQYGVVPGDGTTVTHLPLSQAVGALLSGEHEAGFFMLAPDNPLVQRMAIDPALTLFSFSENVGLARRIGHLKPATLARGAFDLRAVRPARDTALVGATVNVVVREDLHPAVLYALLAALKETHKGPSLVSDAGEYPTLTGAGLPAHELAAEWAKAGTPWLYSHLPATPAGLIDAYWGPGLFLLAVVSAFGTLRSINEFIQGLVVRAARLFLAWQVRRVDAGRAMGPLARRGLRWVEGVVLPEDDEGRARAQIERLRAAAAGSA